MLLGSCASTLQYALDYPLTDQTISSSDSSLTARVPLGWFAATERNSSSPLQFFLIRDDFSAALSLRELQLDARSAEALDDDGAEFLAQLSLAFHRNDSTKPIIIAHPKEFNIGERELSAYETKSNTTNRRFVVFAMGKRFFECEATTLKRSSLPDHLVQLFKSQQALVSSLRMPGLKP